MTAVPSAFLRVGYSDMFYPKLAPFNVNWCSGEVAE